MGQGRIVMGLLFFPRGGSAYVVRYLSPALARAGWSVSLAVGSLGVPGEETHAPTFFDGLDVHVLDSTDAVRAFEAGGDAIAAPSADAPVVRGPRRCRRTWCSPRCRPSSPSICPRCGKLRCAPRVPIDADVFHLHHLTPQFDAAHRFWPHVPLVAHLHGTELKLIEAIAARGSRSRPRSARRSRPCPQPRPRSPTSARDLDAAQVEMLRTTRWDSWRHGEFWAARLKQQAQLADHLITVSPQNRDTAISMLGIEPDHVTAAPERGGHRALPAAAPHARSPPGRVPARCSSRTRKVGRSPALRERWRTPKPTSTGCSAWTTTPPCCSSSGGSSGSSAYPRWFARSAAAAQSVHATGLARDLGWAPGRVGRRAPRHGGRGGRDRRHLLRGLARPRRSS